MSLGHTIREKRLEKKLTQAELARLLGVGQNYIAYLETDQRRPSHEILKKLSQQLSISFDQLFFLAYPDTKNHFAPQEEENKKMDSVLHVFRQNKALLDRHGITKNELKLLESVRTRGKIKKEEDYVKLIETIRKVYQR